MGQITTYQELVEAIERDGVAQTVKANRKPPLHTRILRELYELYPDCPEYITFLAEYPLIPSDLAEKIASEIPEDYIDIAKGLAANPRSSQITLSRLCSHTSAPVRLALAANPNLTPKECLTLVEDPNEFVRATLALNPSLPSSLQFVLSADERSAVRLSLAGRKKLDADIAVHLSCDKDSSVRAAIVQTWSQDPELLHYWAESGDSRNQKLLLQRTTALEPAILEALALSPYGNVRRTAIERSGMSEPHMLALAESESPVDRIFLAQDAGIPAAIQRILAQDTSLKVRRRLASNRGIDNGIALHIAASDEPSVCRALAQNPAISTECLSMLCTHADDQVALLVAYRDDLEAAHLELLLNERTSSVVAEHLAYLEVGYEHLGEASAVSLSQSKCPKLRHFALRSRKLDVQSLQALASDPYIPNKLLVAQDPSTPASALQALSEDLDRDVVFAAEDHLARRDVSLLNSRSDHSTTELTDSTLDESRPILKRFTRLFKE